MLLNLNTQAPDYCNSQTIPLHENWNFLIALIIQRFFSSIKMK